MKPVYPPFNFVEAEGIKMPVVVMMVEKNCNQQTKVIIPSEIQY